MNFLPRAKDSQQTLIATKPAPGLIHSSQQLKAKIYQGPLLLPYPAQEKPVCKRLTFRQLAPTTANLLPFFFFNPQPPALKL